MIKNMITLFENFIPKIDIVPFITKSKDETGETIFKIPSFSFEHFSEWFVNNVKTQYNRQIKYNILMRFYIYLILLRYNGNDETILSYIKGIKNGDKDKIEIIDKIPNNLIVMRLIVKEFNLGYPIRNDFSDVKQLKKFILNYQNILSEENLVEYIGRVVGVSKKSKKSERIIRGVMNMFYGRYFEIKEPSTKDDKAGIDIWMIEKETGDRRGVQVKDISPSVTFDISDDEKLITITNTSLDLKPHRLYESIEYDYLVFFIEKDKKVCIIKSTAIQTIQKYDKTIRITLHDWSSEPKFHNAVFKYIDIPAKFLPKDSSEVFYDPDISDLFD